LIQGLLTPDREKRLGSKHGAIDVKEHAFFSGTNFSLILQQVPPIIPKIDLEELLNLPPLVSESSKNDLLTNSQNLQLTKFLPIG